MEKHLTGQETEPWEIVYFKVYKSQLPVIEQALETATLMLGSDKARGYCLEMICADFLAGASLDGEMKSLTAACPHEPGLATAHQAPEAPTRFKAISALAELNPKARRLAVPILWFAARVRSSPPYTAQQVWR
ncbi:MAG TPA: hypothetical protein VGT04_06040 [Acidobacteriaceae bacterium]|nr:hypothetical protein [Acidobacteriaceae bacterium]